MNALDLNGEGVQLFNQKRFEEALKKFQSAILLDDTNASIWKNYGDCQYDLKLIKDAFDSYEKAMKYDNNKTPQIALDFGMIHVQEQQYDSALKLLLPIENHPNLNNNEKSDLYRLIAESYYHLKEKTQSLRYLRKREKITSSYKVPGNDYVLLGNFLCELNELPAAVKEFETGLTQYPNDIELFKKIIEIYKNYHLYGRILQLYENEIRKTPDNIEMNTLYIILKYEYKDFQDLVNHTADITRICSDDEDSQIIREVLNKSRNNLIEIRNTLIQPDVNQEAEEVNVIATRYIQKAIYCFYLRSYEHAERFTALSLQKNVNNQGGLFLYGIVKTLRRDFPTAIKMLNIYTKVDNNLWVPYLARAYIYHQLGELDKMKENWDNIPEKEFLLRNLITPETYFKETSILDDLFGISLKALLNITGLD